MPSDFCQSRRPRPPRPRSAATAIIDLGGDTAPREFSVAALDDLANDVARGLVRRGFRRGERVAILSANRAEFLAAYDGILRAGLVAVPVNFKFPAETIAFILRDSGARLVFCDPQRRALCPPGLDAVIFGERPWHEFLDPGPFDAVVPTADEAAMFLYTSGSTGQPKGVVLSHAGQIWVVETRIGGQDLARHRFLIAAPLYHMNALALSQLASIAHASIVLLPQFDAGAYIAAVGRYRCTWLTAVPPMMAMMLRQGTQLAVADLSSVEHIRMGSAPVSASLMDALRFVPCRRPRSPTPMARPRPGRWCSAPIRAACRSRICRSGISIRGWRCGSTRRACSK